MSTVLYPLHDPSPGSPQPIRDRFGLGWAIANSPARRLIDYTSTPAQRRCLIASADEIHGAVAIAGPSTDAQIPIAI